MVDGFKDLRRKERTIQIVIQAIVFIVQRLYIDKQKKNKVCLNIYFARYLAKKCID